MTVDLSLLISALNASQPDDRLSAAARMSALGEKAQAAAVSLVRACADEDEEVREWVVAALEDLGPPSVSDTEALADLLPHESADVSYWAATLLGRLEADAAAVTPQLVAALETSPHRIVRERAAWALGKIGPRARSAEPALRQAAASREGRLAAVAEKALRRIRA